MKSVHQPCPVCESIMFRLIDYDAYLCGVCGWGGTGITLHKLGKLVHGQVIREFEGP